MWVLCWGRPCAASPSKDGWSLSCSRSLVPTTTNSRWSFLARRRRWWGQRLVAFSTSVRLWVNLLRFGKSGFRTGWFTQCLNSGELFHFLLFFYILNLASSLFQLFKRQFANSSRLGMKQFWCFIGVHLIFSLSSSSLLILLRFYLLRIFNLFKILSVRGF